MVTFSYYSNANYLNLPFFYYSLDLTRYSEYNLLFFRKKKIGKERHMHEWILLFFSQWEKHVVLAVLFVRLCLIPLVKNFAGSHQIYGHIFEILNID